jgi:hypothetical protein
MEPVVRCGLIAGAISSEVMVLLVLVNTILIRNYFSQPSLTGGGLLSFWNIMYPLFVILIFEMGGIFSARICRKNIVPGKDAFITGFITGITTGIILEIMWFSQIVSLVAHTGNSWSGTTSGLGSIVMLIIALLLILVIMGGVLSAFGSYIYATRTAQESRASSDA